MTSSLVEQLLLLAFGRCALPVIGDRQPVNNILDVVCIHRLAAEDGEHVHWLRDINSDE
jgi:hypothetical protein